MNINPGSSANALIGGFNAMSNSIQGRQALGLKKQALLQDQQNQAQNWLQTETADYSQNVKDALAHAAEVYKNFQAQGQPDKGAQYVDHIWGMLAPTGQMLVNAGAPVQLDAIQAMFQGIKSTPTAQQRAATTPPTVGNVNPSDYTPESVQAYRQSGNMSDLVRNTKPTSTVGTVNPADYTPESVQTFQKSGNYGDLVPKSQPWAASSADLNAIDRMSSGLFNGFLSPDGSGQYVFQDPTARPKAQAIAARAAELYNQAQGKMSREQAVSHAAVEAGINVPTLQHAGTPSGTMPWEGNSGYTDPAQVRHDYATGKLTEKQATKILQEQFGYK